MGLPRQACAICNRTEIERELRRQFSSDPMGHEIPVSKSASTLQAIRNRLLDSARKKGEAISWLLRIEPWDLFIAISARRIAVDICCGRRRDAARSGPSEDLLTVYEALDQSLGRIVDEVDRV